MIRFICSHFYFMSKLIDALYFLACHVFYVTTANVQDKTGLEAITHALTTNKAFQTKDNSGLLLIQFKVTSQGITLTDLGKKKFVRQQFPTASVSYCAIEEKHTWPNKIEKISKPRYVISYIHVIATYYDLT